MSWKTKKQVTVAKSTVEAKYKAVATTVTEVMWISYVLRDFHILHDDPVILHYDNKFTIQMLCNPTHDHEKTKYIDIDCHFARHHIGTGFIEPSYVPSSAQLADVFIKPLGPTNSRHIIVKLT